MSKPARIFCLKTRDPYFPPGKDPAAYAGRYGTGVLFRVFLDRSGQLLAGAGTINYSLEEVVERCRWAKLRLMVYIDENQKPEAQSECAREAINLTIKYKLAQIAILSPDTEFLALVRGMDFGPVKVLTGRLAGHLAEAKLMTNAQIEEEIEKEAAKGTSIIAFYAYEHGIRAMMSMTKLARRHKIKIFFNIRDESNHHKDITKHAVALVRMTAKGGGGIICNYPPTIFLALKKAKTRPGK